MSIQANPKRFFSWRAAVIVATSFALVGSCQSNASDDTPEPTGKQVEPAAPTPNQPTDPVERTENPARPDEQAMPPAGAENAPQSAPENASDNPPASQPRNTPRNAPDKSRNEAPGNASQSQTSNDPAVLTLMLIDIDTELAAMCSLPASKVYFKHDSAKLLPQAKARLDSIATCAKSGPAKERGLQVIGRTDPSGTDQYNQKLGMSRAESVAKYLADRDVKKARVETESMGEKTADENRPGMWPMERRVTIRLQDE